MTNYSRSVLKSNGLHCPKIRLKSSTFRPKPFPQISPKVTATTLSPTTFNFSHKRPTFAFTGESGYTTRLSEKNLTQGLTRRNRGLPSPGHSTVLCCQRNPFYSAVPIYTYISRFSVPPHHQAEGKNQAKLPHKFYPPTVSHPAFQLPSQTALVRFRG